MVETLVEWFISECKCVLALNVCACFTTKLIMSPNMVTSVTTIQNVCSFTRPLIENYWLIHYCSQEAGFINLFFSKPEANAGTTDCYTKKDTINQLCSYNPGISSERSQAATTFSRLVQIEYSNTITSPPICHDYTEYKCSAGTLLHQYPVPREPGHWITILQLLLWHHSLDMLQQLTWWIQLWRIQGSYTIILASTCDVPAYQPSFTNLCCFWPQCSREPISPER